MVPDTCDVIPENRGRTIGLLDKPPLCSATNIVSTKMYWPSSSDELYSQERSDLSKYTDKNRTKHHVQVHAKPNKKPRHRGKISRSGSGSDQNGIVVYEKPGAVRYERAEEGLEPLLALASVLASVTGS